MGLLIKPKSKLRALQCRIYSWAALKLAFYKTPIFIPWNSIIKICVSSNTQQFYEITFKTKDEMTTRLQFFDIEVENIEDFKLFLNQNSEKISLEKTSYFRKQFGNHIKQTFHLSTTIAKLALGALALIFMIYQIKYFGSLLLLKSSYLIKSSCSQTCAQQIWFITTNFINFLLGAVIILLPLFFYKKIYISAKRRRNIQIINRTITEAVFFIVFGVTFILSASPSVWNLTSKHSKIVHTYANETLQTKLIQKIEFASKKEFNILDDDTDYNEPIESEINSSFKNSDNQIFY